MSVARIIQITSSSPESFEAAVNEGIARAARTLENVTGARIEKQSVAVEDGAVREYRVTLRVTFLLKD